MGRTKNYKSSAAAAGTAADDARDENAAEVLATFPLKLNYAEVSGGRRNPTSTRDLDLSEWEGNRLEPWARAWMRTLTHVLHEGLAVASCVKFGTIHATFFKFLSEPRLSEAPCRPGELLPRHLTQFRQWLSANFKANTAINYHRNVKSMIIAMVDLGIVHGFPDELFPRNAMKRAPPERAATALSDAELQRLVSALKRDLIALHKGTFEDYTRGAMTVYFLVLALRTGGNPTPLLEITRASLKPHLVPGMMRIDLVKERSANTYPAALREKQSIDDVISVPMDGVAILNRVFETTKSLVDRAPHDLKDRIWLYESARASKEILCLHQAHIDKGIPSFVRRHDLRGDDGEPLVLNLSRLRKNKAQQLFKMSGGDLATVALLLGNTPQVAGRNYMTMTAQLRAEGAIFVGEVLEGVLAGEVAKAADGKPTQTTPVARCKDSLNGEFAPKDGRSHCDQFIHCLGCPSFAIAGTISDLHRLFSFQAFLRAEIDYYPADDEFDEWRAHRQRLIALIDEFVAKKFAPTLVAEARALTAAGLHRYWAIQLLTIQRLRGLNG